MIHVKADQFKVAGQMRFVRGGRVATIALAWLLPFVHALNAFSSPSDEPTCPNLLVDPDETCDDGNLFNYDGCDSTCHLEPFICGNGVVNPGEECDDGNLVAGDGCDAACVMEPPVCGNGILESDEECDDHNLVSGDGCDSSCRLQGATGIRLSVGTSNGNDTLVAGVVGSIIFKVEAPTTTQIAAFMWPMIYRFSNGNLIGPIELNVGPTHVTLSKKAQATLPLGGLNRTYARSATDPDTTQLGQINFLSDPWTGSGEAWRITFVPSDRGTITIDSASLPPSNQLSVTNPQAHDMPFQWQPKTITVVPGMTTGNVNGDDITSSADIIYLVNWMYRQGSAPAPCEAKGDVDCSGIVNVQDIMSDINFVFKRGQRPCNVGGLLQSGVWVCSGQ